MLPVLIVALCVTQSGIATDQELLIKSVVAVSENVLGKSLLKLAVNVATYLTVRYVVYDSEMLPRTGSEIYVGKSVIRGRAVCVGVGKAWITVNVHLKADARTIIATVIADDSTTDRVGVILRKVNPSLKGLDACLKLFVYLVLTEVLYLYTAAVVIYDSVTVAGVVTERRLTHLSKVIRRNEPVTVLPCLRKCGISLNLAVSTLIAVHSNGVNQALEIVGITVSVIATDSEGVGVFISLRNDYRGVTSSLLNAVYVKMYGIAVFCIILKNDRIVTCRIGTYIGLALIEVGYPLGSTVCLAANTDSTVISNLDVDVRGSILAIITNDNAAVLCAGDVATACELKLKGNCRDLTGHIKAGIFLEVAQILGLAGGGNHGRGLGRRLYL